ncbi:hypothetical protein VSDG_06308 [Cytospora chrysosperma]|uniref:GCS light chain n=1 Tax=Cytospora chrysosperma TaxID=252740 RepID=A0A423VSB2_CYTCH|nr:hypothetical protein VSDG_06308 [Valsa sordida]
MSNSSQSFFTWLKNLFLALIDRIYPQRQKRSRKTGTMAKKLILSTGNIVSGGPSIIRKPGAYRSNLELTNSLRSNFLSAKQDYATTPTGNTSENGDDVESQQPTPAAAVAPTPLSSWTAQDGDTLYIPRVEWDADGRGLQEDPGQYEITAKMFFLQAPGDPAARAGHTREALSLVMRELRAPSVSLLIVSFPGMSFDGDCEWEADKANAAQGSDAEELATWARAVEPLHDEGLAARLGIAEFGSEKLARFLAGVRVAPRVDQINVRDCCNVPPPLATLAKDKGIELFVHSDCTDVLPEGTLRELLGPGARGAGVLADPAAGVDDGLRGDLTPQWVIKYTAVVRDRGVIENKGYFAGATLVEE